MLGTKILEERKSKYNGNLKVCKTLGMGTYIQAEGLTQSGGIVESIWKSTLRHIHTKYDVKNILILGLGGGTVAKLLRKKYPDTKITGIDIDPLMIELGKKYLQLTEHKVNIIIGDVSNLANFPKQKFGLIIVDLYQGDKFPEKFETDVFLNLTKTVLADSGTIIFNRLYYGEKRPQAVKFGNRLTKVFSKVDWFYPEANLMFICTK